MNNKKTISGIPSKDLPQSKDASFFEKHPIIPSLDMITMLKLLSRKNRGNCAINCDDLYATYQELIDDSHKLYLAFKELGVKKGDIVTISLPSNYHAITTFFALNELGAITTFIDTYSSENEVLDYLSTYQSPILINFNKTVEENKKIEENSNVRYIITLNSNLENTKNIDIDYRTNPVDKLINFHTLGSISAYQKDSIHLPNRGNDDSLILYTSGSTGHPKAVVLTNKNILAAQMYAANTSHTENITGTKTMTCVPLRYPYGMVTSLLTSLLWCKQAIMTPRWDSNTVNYYLNKKPNIIFGSPAVLELIMRNAPSDMDMKFISHLISGGDFLTLELANRAYSFFREHNNSDIIIGNGCGNAETVSIGSTPVGVPLKQDTAGKILVGSIPMIIDKDIPDNIPIEDPNALVELGYNTIGELCLSGDYVFKGYYNDPEKTRCATFRKNGNRFFRTGTLGFIDKDGYFTPTDRKSRFYIRSTGHKVYLDNVQRIIAASDSRIENCAVVKVPNADELFVNKAYIVLEKGTLPTEQVKKEIFDKLYFPTNSNEQLKEYEIPKEIEFIDILPRVAGTEKIDYTTLEEDALRSLAKAKMMIKK